MVILHDYLSAYDQPAVTREAEAHSSPFRVLVATLISLRTKDEVTAEASDRLFAIADTPEEMASLDETTISNAIRPANYYPTKAQRIRGVASRIAGEFDGEVPADLDTLLSFKGVGRKTANLVLTEGFNLPGICVDTHVHRITNRLGMVDTRTPEQTEFALRKSLPLEYWKPINTSLVSFGQRVCRPQSPFCSSCPLAGLCGRNGVSRSR